jgi:hypothetical protein
MKQAVQRKTLDGNWTPFTFDFASVRFFVKNFSNGAIFVSFENNDSENESVKIMSMMAENLAVCFNGNNYSDFGVKNIYVKGSGEVEVQAIDSYAE